MLEVGDRIDRFVVDAFLGEGGLARVYRVRHEQLGGLFALKVLSFRGKRLTSRLLREGRIQARLKHPNVVTVLDVIEHDGRAGLLMEYVEGQSLEAALNRGGAMPIPDALHLFAQVLAGVSAAHDAGVLHRDLKPGNILLQPGSGGLVAKVTDFGIARLFSVEAKGGDTLQSDVIGTPGYMAPEQASDPTAVDVRADLFSMGALLYGMVTGAPPFTPGPLARMLTAVEDGDFTPVRERLPDCPADLAAAIERCLAPEPDDRFADCRALAVALFGEESPQLASLHRAETPSMHTLVAPDPDPEPPHRPTAVPMHTPGGAPAANLTLAETLEPDAPAAPPPRSKAPYAAAVVALLLLGGGLVWWSSRSVQPAPVVAAPPELVEPARGDAPPRLAPPPPPGASGGAGEATVEVASAAEPEAPGSPPATGAAAEAPDAPVAAAEAAAPPAEAPRDSPEAEAAPETTEPQPAPAEAAAGAPADEAPPEDPLAELPTDPPEPAEGDAVALAEPEPLAEPAPTPEPPPEATPAPPPAPPLTGTWEGRLGGRASTLRIVRQRGDRVEAQLEVLLGTAYRTFDLSGTFDAGRLRLQGEAPDGWALDARLVDGALDGMLTAPGRRKGTAWRGTRQ